MIMVSIPHLTQAVKEADAFALPNMNPGTQYLYEQIYYRLVCGETVRLSEIDFGNFEYDDISAINSLHENVFYPNEAAADHITTELRKISPAFNPVVYV